MSGKTEIAAIAISVIGIVPWVLDMAGIDTSGVLAPFLPGLLGVWRVISPFALIGGGVLIGWFIRDKSKSADAETAARIERENKEHDEKMRREREEREAEKSKQIAEQEHAEKIDSVARQFKKYDVDAKALACKAYDDGEVVINYDTSNRYDEASCQVELLTERETLPDGYFRYTLRPMVREMLDAHPELLSGIREHMKRVKAEME